VAVVTIVVCVFSLPVAVTLLLRTIFYGLAFVLIPLGALTLVEGKWPSPTAVFSEGSLLLSFAFAVGINLALTFTRLLGTGILISLLTGRYHQPREEERIVLFLDVMGSTRLAERRGDNQFHRFLNRVFFDVSDHWPKSSSSPSFDDGRASELAGGGDATLVRAVLFGQGQFMPP
jgi:hypothetical protein